MFRGGAGMAERAGDCLCDHVFRNKNHPPAAFVLVLAAVDNPHASLLLSATQGDELAARMLSMLFQAII